MHSILVNITLIIFLIYLISYILSSLSVIIRKFRKKIKYTNFETAWLMFFIGVFFPPPFSLSGVAEFTFLLIFVIINLFWFIPLIHYYESRIKQELTTYYYGSMTLMIILSVIIFAGWYGFITEDIWYPLSDVTRNVTMGLSLIYCGYLVYNSGTEQIQAKRFEYYSLVGIGLSAFSHGIFHIFVHGFGILHEFDEIANASESLGVYLILLVEFSAFALGAFGFILLLVNTIKNSDYRFVTDNVGNKMSLN